MNNLNEEDEQLVQFFTEEINTCIRNWYRKSFRNDDHLTQSEFKPCCNKDETRIILECANIYLENNKSSNIKRLKEVAIAAIISYYYEIQVLEYYVTTSDDFDCMKTFHNDYKNLDIINVRDNIITSKEEWASRIRKKILNMNGGKKRKKQINRKTKNRKTKNRKTKRRKTKRRKTKK